MGEFRARAVGAFAAAAFVWALSACGDDGGNASAAEDLVDPPVAESVDGVLDIDLAIEPTEITVHGKTFTSNVYNGDFIPPVLVVRRGDEVRIDLTNRIGPADIQIDGAQSTNIHYHGFDISPNPPADDPFLHLDATEGNNVFEYRWDVPDDHPQGAYWYHSHAHGDAQEQVLSGLSGMMLVDGLIEDHYPELTSLRRRIMVMKDIALPGSKDSDPKTKTINGQTDPAVRMQPGEWQVWELGNVGADAFFDLTADGFTFWVLSLDGNLRNEPQPQSSVFLAPGARATVVVQAPTNTGETALRSQEVDTGPAGDPNPDVRLGRIVVDGDEISDPSIADRLEEPPASVDNPTAAEVGALPIDNRRTVTFSETSDGNTFFIDDKQFDVNRVDTTVALGTVEEWTILNTTQEKHVFHIHQTDFLVSSVNNDEQDDVGLRDTIDLPIQEGNTPGKVVVVIPFLNPAMEGKFVYHCHILEHEDGGMMAVIQVTP
jgi:FtsP/CotA-like multicopper oxidase with cupredoxin domain